MISSILCNNTYIEKFNDKYAYINKNSFRQNNCLSNAVVFLMNKDVCKRVVFAQVWISYFVGLFYMYFFT